ncbi:MAG: sigma-70 family RNA polymerase sigma factor [Bacilli bacterium]
MRENIECYDIKVNDMPKEFNNYGEYHDYLIYKIQNNIDKEENLDILFRNCYRFIYMKIGSYVNVTKDKSELMSCASVSFMKSVNSYDHSNGSSFLNFLNKCMRNEIICAFYKNEYNDKTNKRSRTMKKELKDHLKVELDKPQSVGNSGESINISDMIKDDRVDVEMECESNIMLREVFDIINKEKMNDKQKEVCIDYFNCIANDSYTTHRQLAKRHNVSQSYVNRIINRFTEKLKMYIK